LVIPSHELGSRRPGSGSGPSHRPDSPRLRPLRGRPTDRQPCLHVHVRRGPQRSLSDCWQPGETQPLSGRSGSWVIQYSVAGVGSVVNRALTTHSRPEATVAVVGTSRPGSVISPSTTPLARPLRAGPPSPGRRRPRRACSPAAPDRPGPGHGDRRAGTQVAASPKGVGCPTPDFLPSSTPSTWHGGMGRMSRIGPTPRGRGDDC
jgi:hypothetical protein